MKKIQTVIAALLFITIGAFATAPASFVSAASPLDDVCDNNSDSAICENKNDSSDDLVTTIVNTFLYVTGALSVLMIIVGGFQYVTSQGNSANVTKAKNTILYAVVGLIVSVLAFAIVNWVVRQF
jgi:hypothetical protein